MAGWRNGILAGGAALSLVLVIADFVLAETNRSVQAEVNARQQFINQSIEFSRVNQALVNAIAIAATKDKDSKLGQILAEQGISIAATPPSPAASPPASAPGAAPHPSKP